MAPCLIIYVFKFYIHLKSHNGPIACRSATDLDVISCPRYVHKMLLNISHPAQRVQEDIAESTERDPFFMTSIQRPTINLTSDAEKWCKENHFLRKLDQGIPLSIAKMTQWIWFIRAMTMDINQQYSLGICSSNSCICKQNRSQNMRCFPSHRGITLCFTLRMFRACYSVQYLQYKDRGSKLSINAAVENKDRFRKIESHRRVEEQMSI